MRVFLAPMEGVVDPIVRDIWSQLGGYDQCVTEFVRVTSQLNPEHVFFKYSPELKNGGRTPSGAPVFLQLLGSDPKMMALNARRAVALGAPGIDVNFGCPAKTVNRHDGGATLLQRPRRLFEVGCAIKEAVGHLVPVTAKVRLGFESTDLCLEIAEAVADAHYDHLVIHARTKTKGYRPPAHWQRVGAMKRHRPQIPMLNNGDLWTLLDYQRATGISECEDVALGRSAMANPFLARQLKQPYEVISGSWEEVMAQVLIPFIEKNISTYGEARAIRRLKQMLRYLMLQYIEAEYLFRRVKRLQHLGEVTEIFKKLTATPLFFKRKSDHLDSKITADSSINLGSRPRNSPSHSTVF